MHDDTAYYKENRLVNQIQEIIDEMISRGATNCIDSRKLPLNNPALTSNTIIKAAPR
jgi:hypothetical protein